LLRLVPIWVKAEESVELAARLACFLQVHQDHTAHDQYERDSEKKPFELVEDCEQKE
jgi:hypothetical protein